MVLENIARLIVPYMIVKYNSLYAWASYAKLNATVLFDKPMSYKSGTCKTISKDKNI